MKSIILTAVILPLSLSLSFGAGEKEIRGEITHVTLYPDRAQITSEAAISLQPGINILVMKGLSPYIIRSTIQVGGEGNFTIMGISHSNNFLAISGDSPEVKEIKARIEVLNARVEEERTAMDVLKEKENFLVANRVVTGKDVSLSAEQYRAMLELYSSNIDQIRTTILKKNRLVREYEKELQDLNNQLSQSMGKRRLPTGEITVTVTASRALAGKLSIGYVVTNAGWTPSYDIRVDDINKPLTLVYMANVHQTTGNDWKGVKLSFTNASPAQSGVIPVLNTWYLNFLQPSVPVMNESLRIRGVTSRPSAKSDVIPESADEALIFVAAEAPAVGITQGTTTLSFDLLVPSDILSDGQSRTIEIGRTTANAGFAYESVPKLDPKAYLTGRIEKWEELNIIGGEGNLYFENTFVGQSYLSPAQFGDTMKISLGSDRGISIKRDRQTELTSKRLIGSNRIDTRSFKITVRNNKRESVSIRITDQIPVSSNSEITVEATQLSGGRLNAVTGIVTWDFALTSQESRELILTYTVKYPKDKEIILE